MKKILFFLVSVIIGIVVVFGYTQLSLHSNTNGKKQSVNSATKFSLINPPSQSLRGTIASISGEVAWQSRIATEPAKISAPQMLQQGENIVTGDTGTVTVQFTSSGTITLAPQTELDIIQTLPVNFVFAQNKGTATYSINGTIPISIRSLHVLLSLQPGNIVITTDKQNSLVTAAVYTGSIQAAFNDIDYMSHVMTVTNGNTLIFHDDTRKPHIVPLL